MFGLNTYCVNLIVYHFFLGKSITNKKLLKDTDVAPILIIITAYNGLEFFLMLLLALHSIWRHER